MCSLTHAIDIIHRFAMSQFIDPFDAANFTSGNVDISPPPNDPDVRVSIFYRHFVSPSPSARPILLLHGHPQTHVIWSDVAPLLAASGWHVVVPDNRGNGLSSAPEAKCDGERYSRYSKREMARDMVELMSHLGYERFHILAHDRGARIAHRLALDFDGKVAKMILLDIAPTLDMYDRTDAKFASAYWHWFFLLQPSAEALIGANPRAYLEALITRFPRSIPASSTTTPTATDGWRMQQYLDNISKPASLVAMCEDYRASAPVGAPDLELDRADRKAGRKVECPTRVLWGGKGVIELMYGGGLELWKNCCEEVEGRKLDCGHYVPEEAPSEVLEEVKAFFD